MTEDAKIGFLFRKVQHSGLKSAVEATKAKIATESTGTVTYMKIANYISSPSEVAWLSPCALFKLTMVFFCARLEACN